MQEFLTQKIFGLCGLKIDALAVNHSKFFKASSFPCQKNLFFLKKSSKTQINEFPREQIYSTTLKAWALNRDIIAARLLLLKNDMVFSFMWWIQSQKLMYVQCSKGSHASRLILLIPFWTYFGSLIQFKKPKMTRFE